MKVVIAEKPSLANTIIAAIGSSKFKREDGYAESSDYIVTWVFGHLFELVDLEDYPSAHYADEDEESKGWTLDNLPFCPDEFKFRLKKDKKTKSVDSGVRKQFYLIKKLLDRKDVDGVFHAGDSDREGEIIIRNILTMSQNKKPVYRLWLPSQTPDVIRDSLRAMEPDGHYDNMAQEGYARTYIDWLLGINLTRIATIQSGTKLRVGRVIVPIVKAIYDRDMEIKNFKPVPYLVVSSNEETAGEKIRLTCKKTFSKEDRESAQALADYLNSQRAVVSNITKEEKTISAGKLLNQSKLQALAGRKYKLSPAETLEISQKLYEGGYTTYPRTPSEYLATSERSRTNRVIEALQARGYKVMAKDNKKSIYDDSKVESHSAITPTAKLPEEGALSHKEQLVYDIILSRFLAVFCSEPCKVNRTTMFITVGDEQFRLKGDVFIQRGWMEYDDSGKSEKVLPDLAVGDTVNINFKVEEKETKPPTHYTVGTLGAFLQNPFKKTQDKATAEETENDSNADDPDEPDAPSSPEAEDDLPDDDEDYKAILAGLEIGTEATRADIINKAIKSNYISLKNNVYTIQPAGIYYIEALWKMGIILDKHRTAELGRTLKKVYRGEISIQDSIDHTMAEINTLYDSAVNTRVEKMSGAPSGSGICKCPLCGGDIREGKKNYYCSNYKTCSLKGLWKEAHFVNISAKDVVALLKGSTISKTYKTRSGGKASKKLRFDIQEGKILDVSNEPITVGKAKGGGEAETLKCPSCGSPIIERPKSFSCNNAACGFILWKESKYFSNVLKITSAKAKALLSGKHAEFELKSREGKPYNGYLKLKANGKYAGFEPDGYPNRK